MKRSIFSRLFLSYALIIVLLVVSITAISISTLQKYYIASRIDDLKKTTQALETPLMSMIQEERIAQIDPLLKKTARAVGLRLTVIRPDGMVIADSDEAPAAMGNHRDRPEVRQALQGASGIARRYSVTMGRNMLYVAEPVKQNGQIKVVLRASYYTDHIDQVLGQVRGRIILVAFFVVLGALFLAVILSRQVTGPLRGVGEAAHKIAQGDFTTRVPLGNEQEVRELAIAFNEMTERVRDLFDEITRQKTELLTIISSMQEGLVVIDKDGKIKLANDSFRTMFSVEASLDVYYWQAIRDDGFISLIRKVHADATNHQDEILVRERIYAASAVFVPVRGDIVVLLRDITDAKDLERIKRDFIVNVSHELRTPLTAVKGFVETLRDEVTAEQRHYVDIIGRHTDRLIAIVQDLLLLSELENKEQPLTLVDIDLVAMINEIKIMFEQRLQEKKLTFTVVADPQRLPVRGDAFKLEQVFINLIDNAIKYTETGGITITLQWVGPRVTMTIVDTGIGIPYDAQQRIFERFYVADRSRSRKLGGTGLGLSIVKHIVLLHNGTINVTSEPGQGTVITISLPI